ncbi:MAG: hypothetical protein ACOYEV_09525 [Candidatus Nanopelagicales bacterium]
MVLIGKVDFGADLGFTTDRVLRAFGSGPYCVLPRTASVLRDHDGGLLWSLDIARAFDPNRSHASLTCTVGADYELDAALAAVRRAAADATVIAYPLREWEFRVQPAPWLVGAPDLLAPLAFAPTAGLAAGRLVARLSVTSAQLVESLLAGGELAGRAEATADGVSPRVPLVVRFEPRALLDALLSAADSSGALPWAALVAFFRRNPADLPLDLSGEWDSALSAAFAETMADRLVARSGEWISAADLANAPVVRLRPGDPGVVSWALSEPALVQRRIAVAVDLLSAAQEQARGRGTAGLVTRRDDAGQVPLGRSRLTILSTVPAARVGVEVLGVEVVLAPNPPSRPQAFVVSTELNSDDPVQLTLPTAPGEVLRARVTAYAVVADETGVRRLSGPAWEHSGPVLRVDPERFPIELAVCAISPDLALQAVLSGACAFVDDNGLHVRRFVLDRLRPATVLAIPAGREWMRLDLQAVPPEGGEVVRLAPFESSQVRLDLSTFPNYGPQVLSVRCDFDDTATSRGLSLLADGVSETPENITTLGLTPGAASRTFAWFSPSIFARGVRYRSSQASGWQWHPLDAGELVVRSSELAHPVATRESAVTSQVIPALPAPSVRVSEAVLAGRESAPAGAALESAVLPVATSPAEVPTDELVYARSDPPGGSGYVPRYELAMQTVNGQPAYWLAMVTSQSASTLTLRLNAVPAGSVAAADPGATELPHTLAVQLNFLIAAGTGARKVLAFTDVTRNGAVVTAGLTFATLVERDDVYDALTNPARGAQLAIQRLVDLSVPVPAQAGPIVEVPPLGLDYTHLIPRRPPIVWPPRGPARPFPPDVDLDYLTVAQSPVRDDFATLATVTKLATLDTTVDAPLNLTANATLSPTVNWGNVAAVGLNAKLLTLTESAPVQANSRPARPSAGARVTEATARALTGVAVQRVAFEDKVALRRRIDWEPVVVDPMTRPKWFPPGPGNGTVEPEPVFRSLRADLGQVVTPQPFSFSPTLHSYIFSGIDPSGSGNRLIRHSLQFAGRWHTYLQDASRPWVVYVFPDAFKIARRPEAPFTPFATVRVTSAPDGSTAGAVFDYVVAPFLDRARLADARPRLLADPAFGQSKIEFQPFATSEVSFAIDRPTASGSVKQQRPDAAVVLSGILKDTLSMPLDDFRLLFDALHSATASLFLGHVDIAVAGASTEVIPFAAKLSDLVGEVFLAQARWGSDGMLDLSLINGIESPLDVPTLGIYLSSGDQVVRGRVVEGLPRMGLAPGEGLALRVAPDTALPTGTPPEVILDTQAVKVLVDAEAAWNSMLDRTTLAYFRVVRVKLVASVFDPVPGREQEQIQVVLVEFESGGTVELPAPAIRDPANPFAEGSARIDYPIDDVILHRPVGPGYRYTVTVLRANGTQQRDAQPTAASADVLYLSVVR